MRACSMALSSEAGSPEWCSTDDLGVLMTSSLQIARQFFQNLHAGSTVCCIRCIEEGDNRGRGGTHSAPCHAGCA